MALYMRLMSFFVDRYLVARFRLFNVRTSWILLLAFIPKVRVIWEHSVLSEVTLLAVSFLAHSIALSSWLSHLINSLLLIDVSRSRPPNTCISP